MIEGLIVVAIFGFLTGFVFSIPAAGPVMILITSNGLKGRLRFCHRVTYGAAAADFVYAFVGVFAFSRLYSLYEPYIPYILGVGAVFLVGLGIKITRTEIDFEHMDDSSLLTDKLRNKGGFRIGVMVNFLNPALFIGWLASSFVMISLAAALGLNTGGLNVQLNSTLNDLNNTEISKEIEGRTKAFGQVIDNIDEEKPVEKQPSVSPFMTLWASFVFALMLAMGSTAWFYYLSNFVVAHRKRLKLGAIRALVKGLGVVMLVLGVYFIYSSIYSLF